MAHTYVSLVHRNSYYTTQISDILLEVCKAASTEGVNSRWNKRGELTQPSVFVFKRPVMSLGLQTPPLALGYLLLLVIFGWFSY